MRKALIGSVVAISLGIAILSYVTKELEVIQTESMKTHYADAHFIDQVADKLHVEPDDVTLEITDSRRIMYHVDEKTYSPRITDANIDYLQEVIE